MSLTVLLPVSSSIGVSVQGKDQWAIWFAHATIFPLLRPGLVGESDPSRGTTELGLCVGLSSI